MSIRARTRGILAGLALMAAAAPLSAQQAQAGWSAWIGCWQAAGAPEDAAALCVRPAEREDAGVEILRVEADQVVEREVVWADGARHETVRDGCTGWEEGSFSRDGRRVLLRSSHTCDDGSVQEGGGIMALATPNEWLDVRFLDVGGEPTAWVQRYLPAPMGVWESVGMAELAPDRVARIRAARVAAAQAPDVDDVIEASGHLPAAAVEAWIAEKGDPMALDADQLVAMADAGVADRVIDVVVAVSNPDVFTLTAQGGPERVDQPDAVRRGYRGRAGIGFYDPFFSGRWRMGVYPFSAFGYGGWGYDYWNYGYGYGYRPTVIVVDRDDGPRASGGGRVIAGRGYRAPRASGGGGGDSGSSARPAQRRGGVSPSSGSSSSRPSVRSGSSGPTRKAKPRPKPKGGSGGGGLF